MEALLLEIISFIVDFDAPEYFSQNSCLTQYFGFMIVACLCSRSYMSAIYSVKKSDEKKKYIRKAYPIYQRIFLVHWYKNIYKKVDRFWFDIAYWGYLIHLLLFIVVMLLTFLSRYIPVCNFVTGIIYSLHIAFIVVTVVLDILAFKIFSSNPGKEYPDEKKYCKKN